jgi:Tol biopolymer transport system component/imidazolonepropionase-like amidohydrolase
MSVTNGLMATSFLFAASYAAAQSAAAPARVDIPVHEGTSMSVAVSPDGRTLAIDLQGSIWTLPATGGAATRLSDLFEDARQPVWSRDGRLITFFGYREGGYDIWAMAPDGSNLHTLTWGPYDDREPAWSHDGTRIAFSSDRGDPLGSNYNIWVLDTRDGSFRQLTHDPSEDYMPSWSPDDSQIVFASRRDEGNGVWAVNVADGVERNVATASGTVDAPSWGPGGEIVYHVLADDQSRLELAGKPLTGNENAFPFRVSWASPSEFYYVSDGKIRKRSLGAAMAETVELTAMLQALPPMTAYEHRRRDFTSTTPRQALGIVRPEISPDGTQVAFAALGDIYVMPVGGAPVNITNDRALDTDPSWSPDGTRLVYSSDRDSGHLQLWIRDMRTAQSRRVTNLTTQPQAAAWSADGERIAFLNIDGMWRVAQISVLDVASGVVTKVHDRLPQPGAPTWSPDGRRIALAGVVPYSRRFREGTNQVLTVSAEGGDPTWYAPVPTLSIDSRGGCGPAWSPDGKKMAAIYEGVLAVWPVAASGEPLGPPRRMTTEIAHSPSWTGDSRHILYQSNEKLRLVDIETGETRTVPLDLTYTPAIPTGRLVVHAGKLLDMADPTVRNNVDIVIDGNRIVGVAPHADSAHASGTVVDASQLTVMPGLVEFHSHRQKDFGEAQSRAWLAFGVTTVRSPGNTPYEGVEDREAVEAGVRPGPRVYTSGYLMEWKRVYYKMGIAISSVGQFEMELERSKALQHDFIKSYVRLPDQQQRRMVEFAHGIGIPVATHEIYPAAYVGVDNTEHVGGTSRRGYSPKTATLRRSYGDVISLLGKGGRIFCPMIAGGGVRKLFENEPELRDDPRFELYPDWIQEQVARQPSANRFGSAETERGGGKMVMDAMNAGALICAGTDSPNGINLHGELMSYVEAGMTPFEALTTATVNPARALGQDTGTIEPGKLADIIMIDGDPLENIADMHNVRRVIANGSVYEMSDLLEGAAAER